MPTDDDRPITENELLSLLLSSLLYASDEKFAALIVVAQTRGRDADEKRLLFTRLLELSQGVDPCRGHWSGVEAMLNAGDAKGARRLLEAARRRWPEHPLMDHWESEVADLEDMGRRIDARASEE